MSRLDGNYFGKILMTILHRFPCYQTGNPADARDCAQETFIRSHPLRGQLPGAESEGLSLTIAANACRDYFKKLYPDRELNRRSWPGPAGQERDFTENCGQSSLLVALSRPPGVQREALNLYYFDELENQGNRPITGTNTATVKSRLH